MKTSTTKRKLLSLIAWFLIWTLVSLKLDNNVLFPMPSKVLISLLELLKLASFYLSILNSILNIGLGLLLGIVLGIALAGLTYLLPVLEDFIKLPINLLKSTPIASITVLLLIWISARHISTFIVLLIVLPSIYFSSLAGLRNTDEKLLEMAQVFKLDRLKKLKFIYLDKLKEFLLPSIVSSIGLAWKSGISGEVLGLVKDSIGENIYYSKLYLNTSELFAWTITIVALSKVFDFFIRNFLNKVVK